MSNLDKGGKVFHNELITVGYFIEFKNPLHSDRMHFERASWLQKKKMAKSLRGKTLYDISA